MARFPKQNAFEALRKQNGLRKHSRMHNIYKVSVGVLRHFFFMQRA